MAQLALYLFGSPRLEHNNQPVEMSRRKAMALLIYLALTGRPHQRDTLATLLWPELDQSRARGALRRTLSALNNALPGNWLRSDRDSIALNATQNLWVDLHQFRHLLAECRRHNHPTGQICPECLPLLTQAATLYAGDFLAGFTLRDSPAFDEWQFFQAETLRRELTALLQRLVDGYYAAGQHKSALNHARRWVELEPLDEAAHRRLIELYALTGQRAAALRQYQTCAGILQQELGIAPGSQTQALYQQILTRTLNTAPEQPPPAPNIVVQLPTGPHPLFVAREQELAQLEQYLQAALNHRGQVALISGDAGSGKTALVHQFARQVQESFDNLIVAVGNCDAHTGSGDPYLPFREMLALLAGQLEPGWSRGAISRENGRRLLALAPRFQKAVLERGPDLVGGFISGVTFTASGTLQADAVSYPASNGDLSQEAQSRLFEQFNGVLHALAQQHPLLLVVDDAQWADAASLNLLFHLGRRLAAGQILLIITYRPDEVALGRPLAGAPERHPLERVVNEIRRVYGDVQIDLSRAMGRHFVDALLDAEPNQLGPGFRRALHRQTEGHPLFTIELLRALQERGNIVRDEAGRWVEGAALDWTRLPARVEAVIEERIGRLPPNLRRVLAAASVEGEIFTAQIVARVQHLDERELLRALSEELEKRHQLVKEQGELQVGQQLLWRYQFVHTLFQQYLYNSLSVGERRLLHGEIAQALEEIYRGRLDEIAVHLARHYTQAGQVERAVDYLLQAGDRARSLYANHEAIDFYQQALDALKQQGDYDRAARTLMKLGLTHHLAFNFPQARQAYAEGFTLWQRVEMNQPASPSPAPHPFRTVWFNPPTLDPTMAGDDTSLTVITQIFSGLVAFSPELDVVPEVAKSWEVLDGGSRYVFHLRRDVLWSDGLPVTAHDFIFAWRRILNPAVGSPNASYWFDIKGARDFYEGRLSSPEQIGITALDDYTLQVELEGPTSYFPQLLANFMPVPRHAIEKFGNAWTQPQHIVTNGPFLLERYQRGRSITLRRNPGYQISFSGNLQQVELNLQTFSWGERAEFYRTHACDMLGLFSSPESDQLRQQYTEEYFSGPALNTQYLGFNVTTPPFNDVRVRRAFAMAIDKEMVAGVILRGYVFPALGGFVPPGMPGHSPDIGLPYQPEQARQLLAQAGYPAGRNFPTVQGMIGPFNTIEGDYLQTQWREVLGINVTWQVAEWERMLDELPQVRPHLFRMGWSTDYPDPDNPLRVGATSFGRSTGWQNATYTQLVEQARRITNHQQRAKLYHQADKILIEEASVVPLVYGRRHILVKPWVSRFPTSVIKWYYWKDVVIEPHERL